MQTTIIAIGKVKVSITTTHRDGMMEDTKKELASMMEATKEQIQLEKENFKKEAKNSSRTEGVCRRGERSRWSHCLAGNEKVLQAETRNYGRARSSVTAT